MAKLAEARPKVKEAIKDPDMCECVKGWSDDIVDYTWPLLEEEVEYELDLKVYQPVVEVPSQNTFCLCIPCVLIRSWWRFTMFPANVTIWKQMKTFSWWLFTLISVFPLWGVQAIYFFFMFICIDKTDEWQLVNFIILFKKLQFVTMGVLNAVISYYWFFSRFYGSKLDEEQYETPNFNFYYDLLLFFIQVVLVWIAYFLLPCSKQKGHPVLKYKDAKEPEKGCACNFKRGGIMQFLMLYDIGTFIVSIIFFVYMETGKDEHIPTHLVTEATRIIYGILSFPFLIFVVPVLGKLLSKARSTVYLKNGQCVPKLEGIKFASKKTSSSFGEFDINGFFDEELLAEQ